MSGVTSRAEKAAVAVALRAEGKTAPQIADALGVSRSYAAELYLDPDGAKGRARKDSYRGTCEGCGKPTDGSNGRAGAPKLCQPCLFASPEYRAKITKWSAELLLERIREWASIYGEPPAMHDWNPWTTRHILHDEWRAIRFENDDRWPWMTEVVNRFGSWNAAIAAAGFEPRAPVGSKDNLARRRDRQKVSA